MSDQAEEFSTPDRPPFWYPGVDRPQPEDILNDLVGVNINTQKMFDLAAENVTSTTAEQNLQTLSDTHEQIVHKLQEAIVRLGGTPRESGDLDDLFQRAWIKTKTLIEGKNDQSLLTACLEEINEIEDTYEKALKYGLPNGVEESVRKQSAMVQQSKETVQALLEQDTE